MSNNIFNSQQNQMGGYYPYGYHYGVNQIPQELAPYFMPQGVTPALKGRPVSSFEEARVAQIDLDGSVFIFPDLGNKRIYTKRINNDGTASLNSYVLEERPIEATNPAANNSAYVTKEEFNSLKKTLDDIATKLAENPVTKTPQAELAKLNF